MLYFYSLCDLSATVYIAFSYCISSIIAKHSPDECDARSRKIIIPKSTIRCADQECFSIDALATEAATTIEAKQWTPTVQEELQQLWHVASAICRNCIESGKTMPKIQLWPP